MGHQNASSSIGRVIRKAEVKKMKKEKSFTSEVLNGGLS